ncbi:MAG: hypothetical protein ACPH3C_07405, partial [Glaciecola sp.]
MIDKVIFNQEYMKLRKIILNMASRWLIIVFIEQLRGNFFIKMRWGDGFNKSSPWFSLYDRSIHSRCSGKRDWFVHSGISCGFVR